MRHLSKSLLLLIGCTAIGNQSSPSDWPKLDVAERHVSHREMRDACAPFAPPMFSPEGCAIIDFAADTCVIYVSIDFPSQSVLEHEHEHCAGRDHVGSATLRDAWARWKKIQDGTRRITSQ
mgnify:CR=1 FL=1